MREITRTAPRRRGASAEGGATMTERGAEEKRILVDGRVVGDLVRLVIVGFFFWRVKRRGGGRSERGKRRLLVEGTLVEQRGTTRRIATVRKGGIVLGVMVARDVLTRHARRFERAAGRVHLLSDDDPYGGSGVETAAGCTTSLGGLILPALPSELNQQVSFDFERVILLYVAMSLRYYRVRRRARAGTALSSRSFS
ncbi:BQ5605_C009g05507 [Microbotryum silenes-dioicae]|uniref:BQ5605_C009g05507 protein n=1 Tax=Microbotryum silenes-dioicae TaxID=796604 RepID=A0A2X0MD48_9BASI|nr:BQ5605_C009g05507 [Microbotryum silenes-dioicae]